MTNKVKAQGLVPDRKNCWEFFIKLIRKNLHVVLAFSPVGDDFRNRAKKFPALVNCTVIGENFYRRRLYPVWDMSIQRVPSVCYIYALSPRWTPLSVLMFCVHLICFQYMAIGGLCYYGGT